MKRSWNNQERRWPSSHFHSQRGRTARQWFPLCPGVLEFFQQRFESSFLFDDVLPERGSPSAMLFDAQVLQTRLQKIQQELPFISGHCHCEIGHDRLLRLCPGENRLFAGSFPAP